MFAVNKSPTSRDLHKFGWAMLAGFGVIGLLLWLVPWVKTGNAANLAWAGAGKQILAIALWALGTALFVISFAPPPVAKPVYVAWMSAVVPIGVAMSTVLLTLLFVLLLPVFSLIVRFGDPLRRRLRGQHSYWEVYKPYEPTLERTKRPF